MSNPSDSLESVVIGDGVVVKGTFVVPSKAIVNGVIEGDLTAEEVRLLTNTFDLERLQKFATSPRRMWNSLTSESKLAPEPSS